MSSSIRPPGGPAPEAFGVDSPHSLEGPEGVREVSGASGTSGPAPTEAAAQAGQAQGAHAVESPTASWLRRLEAGEVTRAEAVDGLVAEAVERHGGARLSAAQRGQLEGVLRTALLEDPVLSRLLGDS